MGHPCLSCGACCAHFRVAFHWSEADPTTGGITPAGLTEAFDPHRVVMRGTQSRTPRCVALHGEVGREGACTIYAQRPSPCHALVAAWENGLPSPQCDRARLAHGLQPLTPAHWTPFGSIESGITLALAPSADSLADTAGNPLIDGQMEPPICHAALDFHPA